jgi:tetratricopeptide (TPR) repeat protein
MIDPNEKSEPQVSPSEVCRRAFELMAAKQFTDAERLLAGNMSKTKDDVAIALYHSALGVLNKMKGEFKTAWRHYRRAEKLLPDDPALKIISARLLIDEFAEYDQAIRKAKKVLELSKGNPVFAHQAYTTMGLAWAQRGNRRRALKMLTESMVDSFTSFVSAENIDLNLLEVVLRKGWIERVCDEFLGDALTFAQSTGEDKYVQLFQKMLAAFRQEHPHLVAESGGGESA